MHRLKAMPAPLLACALIAGCAGGHARPDAGLPAPRSDLREWTPEQRQAAYRQFDRMWPAYAVKRGDAVHPLPAARDPIDPRITFDGVEHDVARFMAANEVSGIIAVKNGEVVLERYAFGRQPSDTWVSFSVTKSITSTLVGAAIQDGYIRGVRDPVTRYLPELKGSAYDKVTLAQLMTMRSGVQWNEDYADPDADVWKVGLSPPVGALNPGVRYMKGLKRAVPPGSTFLYNTGETDLVGYAVSAAVGKPLQDYLSEKIWIPYGMESDAAWPMDVGGHARGGCCLSMTLRDYARFGLFALNGGAAGGRDVVPRSWIAEATRMHNETPGYGYFWWATPHVYMALGIYGQAIYIVPGNQLVVVVNSAWPTPWDEDRFARQDQFVRAISDAVRSAGAAAAP